MVRPIENILVPHSGAGDFDLATSPAKSKRPNLCVLSACACPVKRSVATPTKWEEQLSWLLCQATRVAFYLTGVVRSKTHNGQHLIVRA